MGEPLATQADRRTLRQLSRVEYVRQRPGLAAGNPDQQGGCAFDRAYLLLWIHASLEAQRCIGVQTVGSRLAGHECRRPERGLEKHVHGIVGHSGAEPTHDAGQPDHAAIVGDDQGIVVQDNFLLIEQHDFLAGPGRARPDRAADFRVIVTV